MAVRLKGHDGSLTSRPLSLTVGRCIGSLLMAQLEAGRRLIGVWMRRCRYLGAMAIRRSSLLNITSEMPGRSAWIRTEEDKKMRLRILLGLMIKKMHKKIDGGSLHSHFQDLHRRHRRNRETKKLILDRFRMMRYLIWE